MITDTIQREQSASTNYSNAPDSSHVCLSDKTSNVFGPLHEPGTFYTNILLLLSLSCTIHMLYDILLKECKATLTKEWMVFKILVAMGLWGAKVDLNLSARFCIFSWAFGSAVAL